MASTDLFFTRRYAEFVPRAKLSFLPRKKRGVYALLKESKKGKTYDVVYVGLAAGPKASIRSRLRIHDKKKGGWTHYTAFEVWPNIPTSVIQELEGIFRHMYRKDTRVNALNVQRKFKKFGGIKVSRKAGGPETNLVFQMQEFTFECSTKRLTRVLRFSALRLCPIWDW